MKSFISFILLLSINLITAQEYIEVSSGEKLDLYQTAPDAEKCTTQQALLPKEFYRRFFKLTNKSSNNAVIKRVYSDCGSCFRFDFDKPISIYPNQSITIYVDVQRRVGQFYKTIKIESEVKTYSLNVIGNILDNIKDCNTQNNNQNSGVVNPDKPTNKPKPQRNM